MIVPECAGGKQFREVELDTKQEVLSGKLNAKLLALPYEASACLRQHLEVDDIMLTKSGEQYEG